MSRRSTRSRAPPQSLAEEQAADYYNAQDLALLHRAMQRSLEFDSASDSEEEALFDDDESASDEEAEEKETTSPNSQWTNGAQPIALPPFNVFSISVLPRDRAMTEMGYVQCFLTEELVSTIAANTTLYAISKGAPAGWSTNAVEIWRFIAVRLFMGIAALPSMKMYWEEGWRQEYVVKAFSRHRFQELQRYFHIAEPTPAGTKHTVIDKIKPLYDGCLTTFKAYFIPPRELTVDETMVLYKGRSPWTVHMREKPIPIGYKLYTLGSHGYLLTFVLYQGKGGYTTKQDVLHHTVVKVVTPWAYADRIVFLDNLYTSPALCDHLLRIGIRSCGTLRHNRKGVPPGLEEIKRSLKEGEWKAWQRGELGCLAWRDRGPVLMLSTHHRVDDMVTFKKDRGPNRPPEVTKPQVVLDYNKGKGHVDTVDQLRQYYAMERRSRKNWPSLAWWLFDMCIINAYTLWCLDTKAEITQLDFRRALLQQLATAYPPPVVHAHQHSAPLHSTDGGGHWPKHSHVQRRCKHCSRGRGGMKSSEVVCKQCGVHLCLEPCFELWHAEG
jgi:hypothetical protein